MDEHRNKEMDESDTESAVSTEEDEETGVAEEEFSENQVNLEDEDDDELHEIKEKLYEEQIQDEMLEKEKLLKNYRSLNLNFAFNVIRKLTADFKMKWEPTDNRLEFKYNNSSCKTLVDLLYQFVLRTTTDRIAHLMDELNTVSKFEHYCVFLAGAAIGSGYTHHNFINVIGWIYCLALSLKNSRSRDYLINAVYMIADILDIFTEKGYFALAGGFKGLDTEARVNLVHCKAMLQKSECMRSRNEKSALSLLNEFVLKIGK